MIADKIKNARTIKKLTQEQVAEDLNVSRQTISNWEMGVSVPNINTLILISEKFDIPVDEMLKSGDVVEKIDNNKTPFKKDRNYSKRICERHDIARAPNQPAACRDIGDVAKLVIRDI